MNCLLDTKIPEPDPPLGCLHEHNCRRGAPSLTGRPSAASWAGAGEAGAGKDSSLVTRHGENP